MSNTEARSETVNKSPSGRGKDAAMSAFGTKRTFAVASAMPAFDWRCCNYDPPGLTPSGAASGNNPHRCSVAFHDVSGTLV